MLPPSGLPRGLPWIRLMTILCALSTVLNAYDISQKLPPQGPLGVALDYSLATAFPDIQDPNNANVPRNWAWSSHLVFAQPVSTITDAQLWQIALDGYDEMIADAQDYAVGVSNRPKAMSVLAFGNELILASSQKGLTSFSYTYHSTPVLETLRLCQAVWGNRPGGTDSPHNYGGSCAELMAAQLYYTLYTTPLSARAARIATVTLQKKDGQFVPRPKDPCPDNALGLDRWGCNLFVAGEGITVVDKDIPKSPYTLDSLAGGIVVRDQIQLCSVLRVM